MKIREDTQPEREGMIVTDTWLLEHGFGPPRRSNIDQIIRATLGVSHGYTLRRPTEREVDPEGVLTRTTLYRTGAAHGRKERAEGDEG